MNPTNYFTCELGEPDLANWLENACACPPLTLNSLESNCNVFMCLR